MDVCLELSAVDVLEVWEFPKLLSATDIFAQFFSENNVGALRDVVIEAPGLRESTEELLPVLLKRFLNEEALLDSANLLEPTGELVLPVLFKRLLNEEVLLGSVEQQEANSTFRIAKTRLISGRFSGSESQHSVINCASAGGIIRTFGLHDPLTTFLKKSFLVCPI